MRLFVSKFLMFLLFLLMLVQPVEASEYPRYVDDTEVCTVAAQQFEKKYQIKKHLLSTITNVESGRWNQARQRNTAWPWTVNAQGKGRFFDTKQEAIAAVKRLQAKGVKSIDVGCMQINLAYHPDAFKSVEDAFDPQKNAEYAAKFLKKLYKNNDRDWIKAAMAYHSSVPTKALRYKKKIVSAYELVKQAQNNLDKSLFGEQNKVKAAKAETSASKYAKKDTKAAKRAYADANQWREAKLAEWRMKNK